jgi:phosphate:Na+ symporter
MTGLLQILGGLALFMFGIRMLSAGMEKLAGEQIQKWMDRVTNGRLRSATFGAVATALIQSSGLLMVTMIGLINANLMTVEQAIGVMLGQEIGTTLTAQIVAFEIGNYRLILVIAGFLFIEFFSHRELKKYGEILLGLGIVFVGMSFMAQALNNLLEISWVANSLLYIGQHPLTGMLAGIFLTSLTQSSTAVTSLVVAMGISQAINLQGAVGIILGANIGSCITGLIASLRLSNTARQASLAQILINVIGVLLFLPFINPYADLVSRTSSDLPRQIANAHTIFNVTVSALMFPFVRQIALASHWLTPSKKHDEKPKLTAFIDPMQYGVPAVALTEASRELFRLGEVTADMVEASCIALLDQDSASAHKVLVQEDKLVDPVSKELGAFVNRLMDEDLSLVQQKRCFQLKNLLTDIERVGDMAEDIAQYALERIENDVPFSAQANQELELLWTNAHRIYRMSLQAFKDTDRLLAQEVCHQESDFDRLYWHTRQMHIQRLEAGLCHPEADVIYTETLRNLERISDHADNLGVSVARSGKPILGGMREAG